MAESARKRVFWKAFWITMVIQVIVFVAMMASDGNSGAEDDQDYANLSIFLLLPMGLVATPVGWIIPGIVGWIASTSLHPKTAQERYVPAKRGPDEDFPGDWADTLYRAKMNYQIKSPVGTANQIYAQAGSAVVPQRNDVFRAFRLTPLDGVKVVIIGQDPYPQEGIADGLAFSQRGPVQIDSSLHRIFTSMEGDPSLGFTRPSTGDLGPWAKQGVLLLNIALTTEVGKSGVHLGQWADFATAVVAAVRDYHENVAFICMGRHAVDLAKTQLRMKPSHLVIPTAHPTARDLSGSDLMRLSEARPFSAANRHLVTTGHTPIDWQL